MGHALVVKAHYFSWEQNKKEILLQYLNCNFNRLSNNVAKEMKALKQNGISKDKETKQLKEKRLLSNIFQR